MKFYLLSLCLSALLGSSLLCAAPPAGMPNEAAPAIGVQIRQVPDYPQQGMGMAAPQPMDQVQQTLSIIKPDAVGTNHIGDVIARFERAGLRIAGIKMVKLTKDQAGRFYGVHRERPFYPELVEFMSSGPVVVMVLEGNNAIAKNRQLMGATNPTKAEPGTIRADFAESVSRNAVHGSDSPEAAREEIQFFFTPNEVFPRY